VEKESRIEYLRRQRLLEGEKDVKKVTKRAVAHLNGETEVRPNLKLFHKKANKRNLSDRLYPLSANALSGENKPKERVKIRISWRFFSALLTLVFSACLLAGWQLADFKASAIEISGAERITPEEVNAVFNVSQQPIFTVIPEEIIQKISHSFPEFKNINARAVIPNKISISVQERNPILTWKMNNVTLWVDEEGIIIPARGKFDDLLIIESPSLPVISYPKPENESEPMIDKYQEKRDYWKLPKYSMTWFEYHRHIETGLLNAIVQLNTQIPSERTFLYDPHRGLGWNDSHGWRIFVGLDLEKINEKMLAYSRIVSELTSQGIHPSLVSVEYLHAPYYRMD
jgi:cell division protein FtsQ